MAADDVRALLDEAMPPHQTWCQTIGHFDCCGSSEADCDCGIKDSLDELEAVVLGYGDLRAREAAGKALRDAADGACCAWVQKTLRARAEAAERGQS